MSIIQKTLETLYKGIGGQYYYGDNAWKYLNTITEINLEQILQELAIEVEHGQVN